MARTAFSANRASQSSEKRSPMSSVIRTARKTAMSIPPQINPSIRETVSNRPIQRRRADVVMKEIRYYQMTCNMLMRKLPFVRLVKEVVTRIGEERKNSGIDISSTPMRFTRESLEMLQESLEAYIVSLFEGAHSCAIHAKRVTCRSQDLKLLKKVDKLSVPFIPDDSSEE